MVSSIINQKLKNGFKIAHIIITLMAASVGTTVLLTDPLNTLTRATAYGFYLLVTIFIGTVIGYSSKLLIMPRTGAWKRVGRVGTVDDYERIAKKQKDDYSTIYDDSAKAGPCCFTIFVFWLFLVAMTTIPDEDIDPSFWGTSGSVIFLFAVYLLFGILSYEIGFHSTEYRNCEVFAKPNEDILGFGKALSSVDEFEVRVDMEIGIWNEYEILIDTKWKVLVHELPETTYMQLTVDKVYMYAYPYLVGIIVNGPQVEERTERIVVESRFPAIIEYSNDDEVTVLVARFDIPEKDTELEYEPYTAEEELSNLGIVLAEKLKEIQQSL